MKAKEENRHDQDRHDRRPTGSRPEDNHHSWLSLETKVQAKHPSSSTVLCGPGELVEGEEMSEYWEGRKVQRERVDECGRNMWSGLQFSVTCHCSRVCCYSVFVKKSGEKGGAPLFFTINQNIPFPRVKTLKITKVLIYKIYTRTVLFFTQSNIVVTSTPFLPLYRPDAKLM